jgi:hypothetical protein
MPSARANEIIASAHENLSSGNPIAGVVREAAAFQSRRSSAKRTGIAATA